jgi:hypothetical protein
MFVVPRDPDQIEGWRTDAMYLAEKYLKLILSVTKLDEIGKVPTEGKWDGGCRRNLSRSAGRSRFALAA